MRLMITGASGLLGLNLALEASEEHSVVGVVNAHPIRTERFEVRRADLLASGAVAEILDEVQPEAMIHCAALADLDACEADPDLAQRLNAELPGRMAAEAAGRGIALVHISTDAVFNGGDGDYTEEDEPNPPGIYARTKLAGEEKVLGHHSEAIVARVNLFGWSANGNRSLGEFFFNNLSGEKRVRGFTDVDFCPLLVNDLAGILLEMLEKNLSGLYHTVSQDSTSKFAFGVALAEKFGLDAGLIEPTLMAEAGLKAARSANLKLNTAKLAAALGHPLPDVNGGLERFYQLYEDNYPQRLKELTTGY